MYFIADITINDGFTIHFFTRVALILTDFDGFKTAF